MTDTRPKRDHNTRSMNPRIDKKLTIIRSDEELGLNTNEQ